MIWIVGVLLLAHRSLKLCSRFLFVCFPSWLSLFFRCVISIVLSLSSLILSSVTSITLFSPSTESFFFNWYFLVQSFLFSSFFIVILFWWALKKNCFKNNFNCSLSHFVTAALKFLWNSFNICVISMLVSLDCLLSSELWFPLFLVWWVIFHYIIDVLYSMLGDSGSYLKLLF